MKRWIAETYSGTKYEGNGEGGITRTTETGERVFYHNAILRVVSIADMPAKRAGFAWLREHPAADMPEVGKNVYIDSSGDAGWVLSTRIVSVEMLP